MRVIVSDMPLSLTDDTTQDEIERRRADRMARKKAKGKAKAKRSRSRSRITKAMDREERIFFPNLTGEFDDISPFSKHCPRRDK